MNAMAEVKSIAHEEIRTLVEQSYTVSLKNDAWLAEIVCRYSDGSVEKRLLKKQPQMRSALIDIEKAVMLDINPTLVGL